MPGDADAMRSKRKTVDKDVDAQSHKGTVHSSNNTDDNAPSAAPDGASSASDDYDGDVDDWPSGYVEFFDDDDPVEFLAENIPDLPIRADQEAWRRLLTWIGKEYGQEALKQATQESRAGTLTISIIQSFVRRAADVA